MVRLACSNIGVQISIKAGSKASHCAIEYGRYVFPPLLFSRHPLIFIPFREDEVLSEFSFFASQHLALLVRLLLVRDDCTTTKNARQNFFSNFVKREYSRRFQLCVGYMRRTKEEKQIFEDIRCVAMMITRIVIAMVD